MENNKLEQAAEDWRVCYISWKGNIFEVNKLGIVRRQRDGKIMKQYPQKSGYVAVALDGCWKMVHTLVASEFLQDSMRNGDRVDHINTNRADNRLENLRWVDAKGNANNPQTKINMRNAKRKRRKMKTLEQAAEEYAFGNLDDAALYGCTISGRIAAFKAGAGWMRDIVEKEINDVLNDCVARLGCRTPDYYEGATDACKYLLNKYKELKNK